MKIAPLNTDIASLTADALVVGVSEKDAFSPTATAVDDATGGVLTRLREQEEITGKANEITRILAPAGLSVGQLVIVGLGPCDKQDRGVAHRACGAAAKAIAGKARDTVAFCLGENWSDDVVASAISGAIAGCQGQDIHRQEGKLFPFKSIEWQGASTDAIATGQALGEAVNYTRLLVNEPPNYIYPETFTARVSESAAAAGLEVEIWDEQKLKEEKCGSLLGVAQGSDFPPRLLVLRHHGGPQGTAPLALVGKGVTFDSGGLSLKPGASLLDMKCDMAGAATVVGAMHAIAKLKLPVNVIGLAGLVENMPSSKSFRVGDILTARSGKTIEVMNTDAEGRLVLADVLNVAVENGASKIIDLATLTGACLVALGLDVAGLFSNNQTWCDEVRSAADSCGEQAWQMPMFAEFGEQIRSKVADIKNMGEDRWGGAITAAKFLEEFVEETPWVHIDIAGAAWLGSPKPWLDGGGSGAFVRTLVEIARRGCTG